MFKKYILCMLFVSSFAYSAKHYNFAMPTEAVLCAGILDVADGYITDPLTKTMLWGTKWFLITAGFIEYALILKLRRQNS